MPDFTSSVWYHSGKQLPGCQRQVFCAMMLALDEGYNDLDLFWGRFLTLLSALNQCYTTPHAPCGVLY